MEFVDEEQQRHLIVTPPGDVAFDSAETPTSHALPKSQGRSEVHYLLCSKKAVFISFGIN
eukprot:scaffold37555_cov25-Cyclotella_meneghiniana.AAC.1